MAYPFPRVVEPTAGDQLAHSSPQHNLQITSPLPNTDGRDVSFGAPPIPEYSFRVSPRQNALNPAHRNSDTFTRCSPGDANVPVHVQVEDPNCQRDSSACCFDSVIVVVGKQVDYWSQSNGCWMAASISGVDAERGLVELDVKPGVWIGAKTSYVRPRTRPSQAQLECMRKILQDEGLLQAEACKIFDHHKANANLDADKVKDCLTIGLLEDSAMALGRDVDELLGVVGSAIWIKQHIVGSSDKALTLRTFTSLLSMKLQQTYSEFGQAINLEHSAPHRFSDPREKYAFEQQLGAGTYGAVYQACQIGTQSRRAVKIIKKRPSTLASSELDQEIGHLCALDHPHIIKLYEYFDFGGHVYLVMDFCTGGDLQSFVDKAKTLNRPMNEDFARPIFKQVLKAIAHVHARGSMHLDLKCGNVMLAPSRYTLPPAGIRKESPPRGLPPHAMLIDLGLARIFHAGYLGAPCGTPSTMAPEVWRGELTPKADVFSIGVMLFEVLCNDLPFENVPCREAEGQRYWGFTGEVLAPEVPWSKLAECSEEGTELCQKMIVCSKQHRPTASDCLRTPFFGVYDENPLHQTSSSMLTCLEDVTPVILERLTNVHSRTALQHSVALSIARRWPANQLPSIKKAFEALDSAGTGRLHKENLVGSLMVVGVPSEEAHGIVETMDLDRDGVIDWTEFVSSCISLEDVSLEKDLRLLFDHADHDGDGLLSASDLGSMFIAEHVCKDSVVNDAVDDLIDRSNPAARINCKQFLAYFKNAKRVAGQQEAPGSALPDAQESSEQKKKNTAPSSNLGPSPNGNFIPEQFQDMMGTMRQWASGATQSKSRSTEQLILA